MLTPPGHEDLAPECFRWGLPKFGKAVFGSAVQEVLDVRFGGRKGEASLTPAILIFSPFAGLWPSCVSGTSPYDL